MNLKGKAARVCLFGVLIVPLLLMNSFILSGESRAETRYAEDAESPFFRLAQVQRLTRGSIGVATTFLAEVYDRNGTVPATIRDLRVTYPDGTTFYFTSLDYIGSNQYYRVLSGKEPPIGEYTFTVTDTQGRSATSYAYFAEGPALPVPDLSTLQVSPNPLGTLTLSWGGLEGYEGKVFYRVSLTGPAGNLIWTSDVESGKTSMIIPDEIVTQVTGATQWLVEALDNITSLNSYQRSQSDRVTIGNTINDTATPYFDYALVTFQKDVDGHGTFVEVSVRDPAGALPASIQSLEVYDSSGALISNYNPADPDQNMFYVSNLFFAWIPGSPAPGVYRFELKDFRGNTRTTFDYVGSSFDIPLVNPETYQAWGDPLAPRLSWAAPEAPEGMDRPLYFRVTITDESGSLVVWSSPRISATALQTPSGRVEPGVSYAWLVETFDSSYPRHYQNQGVSNAVALKVASDPNPFFQYAGAQKLRDPLGLFTLVRASVLDPEGSVPGSITSLTVTSPGGETHVLVKDGEPIQGELYWFFPARGEFIHWIPGFEPGAYAFTLVKGPFTFVTFAWVGDAPDVPSVDQNSIAVSGALDARRVSWSGVSGFEGRAYYQLEVRDEDEKLVYIQPSYEVFTAQAIPAGILQTGKKYQARVHAQESADEMASSTRSNSAFVWMASEPAPTPTPGPAPAFAAPAGGGGGCFISGLSDEPVYLAWIVLLFLIIFIPKSWMKRLFRKLFDA